MLLEDDSYCYICGKGNADGLGLIFLSVDNKVTAEFTLQKKLQGYKDAAHGGILAAILDEAMIKAALALNAKAITTTEMTVRFRNPLFIGEKAFVEAEIVKPNRRLVEARAFIKGPGLKTIAESRGKLFIAA